MNHMVQLIAIESCGNHNSGGKLVKGGTGLYWAIPDQKKKFIL